MKHTNCILLALGSLISFTAACSGSTASVDDNAPASPSAASTAPTDAPAPPPPSSPDGGGAPAVDAAASPPPVDAGAPDANVDPPMAKHCNVSLVEPDVCIENAQGHVGDVVDVDIVLLGSALCDHAGEANGHIGYDLVHFSVANEVEQVGCRTRKVGQIAPGTPPGDDVLGWHGAAFIGPMGGPPRLQLVQHGSRRHPPRSAVSRVRIESTR